MVSTGPKFAALQRAAEVERGREFEALRIPGLHHCACCLQGGCAVCFLCESCGSFLLEVERANEFSFPSIPSCLATSPLNHSQWVPFIYRAIIFSPL